MYYFILEFVKLHDIAENIIQETFLTLWKKRHLLKEDTNLSAYLFGVAKNNCLYFLRDQRYRQKLFKPDSPEYLELNLNLEILKEIDTSRIVYEEIENIIKSTFAELSPKCRQVFELSRLDEKKNREIAVELDISVKAVESHITKALKIFKAALKDYLPILLGILVH